MKPQPTQQSERADDPSGALSSRNLRIVAIGGGTGLPTVLRGLIAHEEFARAAGDDDSGRITAVVTVTDEGGSSGQLRRELRVLPPGDVRNCLTALADPASPLVQLLQHRFARGDRLRGHPVGNLMLAGLAEMTGDFARAVEIAGEILSVRGCVLPATREDVRLRAQMTGGRIVSGETTIVSQGRRIVRLSLERPVRPLPEVIRALINADAIVVGPGSLYTSILPTLLVDGIASTISAARGVRILVANLMTEPGETDGFTLEDHVRVIRQHVRFDLFDYILINQRPLDETLTLEYQRRGSQPVQWDEEPLWETRAQLVHRNLALEWHGDKIRHEAHDLARGIVDLVRQGRPGEGLARIGVRVGRLPNLCSNRT